MTDMAFERDTLVESGVWWDGALNPMSMDGLRSALSGEDSDAAFKGSDVRWVAWPGLGQQVHVSQVDELLPIWIDIELRRVKHQAGLSLLPLFWVLIGLPRARAAGTLWTDLGLVALTILGWAHALWSYLRMKDDPRAWGLRRRRVDARRAGLALKV